MHQGASFAEVLAPSKIMDASYHDAFDISLVHQYE
jgi:hypothetical protein